MDASAIESAGLLKDTKPDFAEARERWNHYWAGDVWKRPPVVAQVTRPGTEAQGIGNRYHSAIRGEWDAQLERVDRWLESTDFLAESIPHFAPDFAPDQFAAFFGGTFTISDDSGKTAWVEPFVDDWAGALPLRLDPRNVWWQRILAYSRKIREHSRGRYLVGCCDLHSNADTLLAMRGAERLCMDFYDVPGLLEKAMMDLRAAYRPVYEGLYEAGGMGPETGTIGWIPFWCEGRYATIQCDFICMVGPEIARRYIIPALDEEASFLDHCVYHLDGPGTMPHLDDILAIDRIDVIQWVPGAGRPAMHTWTEVLERCQNAGKGLQIYGVNVEQAKELHRKLDPRGVVYCVGARTREEVDGFCAWLEQNT
jgi:5-methyltetrahydrofolate--homocysteine methyltransferase